MLKHKKMDFFMENHQLREELREQYPNGVYTLDLIREGKRISTTRSSALGEVGEKVILYNTQSSDCKEILVQITKVEKLNINTPEEAELWSQKEGWSVEYFHQKPELKNLWQTTFELAENNTPTDPSFLMEEYKSCDDLMKHIDKMIWQLASVVFPIALAGITLFGLNTTHTIERFVAIVVIALGSMILIMIWYLLSRQWAGYQNLTFYRMREIEQELGLWHYRYAIFIKKPVEARRKIIEQSALNEKDRFKRLDDFYGRFPHFGFGKAKRLITTVFMLGWIAVILRECVLTYLY